MCRKVRSDSISSCDTIRHGMFLDYKNAWSDEQAYVEIYRNSIQSPNEFWLHHTRDISWKIEPNTVFDGATKKWLLGGVSNVCYNCVDRYVTTTPDKAAIIWYGDEEDERREISYAELLQMVMRIASI